MSALQFRRSETRQARAHAAEMAQEGALGKGSGAVAPGSTEVCTGRLFAGMARGVVGSEARAGTGCGTVVWEGGVWRLSVALGRGENLAGWFRVQALRWMCM